MKARVGRRDSSELWTLRFLCAANMRTSSTLAILVFYLKAGLVDSVNTVVRSMNQHVLLQVKAKVMLEEDGSLSRDQFQHFDSKAISLQWVLQVDELLFDARSSGSSEDSRRLDEQILDVQWDSSKTEDGWAGTAAYSLLLPLETSTRRSNRDLLLAIWERDLEKGSRRFLSQQLTHVPRTTPAAGIPSDRDYTWKPNTVIEMSIRSRHSKSEVGSSESSETRETTSYGFWVFIAASVAGLLHLWKGPRPKLEVSPSMDESAENGTEIDMVEAENNIVGVNEEASFIDYDGDDRSLSPTFVLLRGSALSSDESDDEEREEQDLNLERPPRVERRMKKSFLDNGVSFVEALDRATEKYILEERSRLKNPVSLRDKAVGHSESDGISSTSSEGAKVLNIISGGFTCSSVTLEAGSRVFNQESPGLLKLGDDFASLDMGSSLGLQTKMGIVESQENNMRESTKEVICKENVLDETQRCIETREDLVVFEQNREEPKPSAALNHSPEKVAIKQSKKRPRDMISSERKECSKSDIVREGSQAECKNISNKLVSKEFPEIGCKRWRGASIGEESATPQSKAAAIAEQLDQKDAEDNDGDVVAPSSCAPVGPLGEDWLGTARDESLDKNSSCQNASVGLEEHGEVASSSVSAGEKSYTSQLGDGERSKTQVDETIVLCCPGRSPAIKSRVICSPISDAELVQVDQVVSAFSVEASAPPDSPYTSTLPPDSSSSYSDLSDDTLRNAHLEYTKTILEKSAELRSVAGDDILAEFVPSAALKTAAMAMKDFSFEFEGRGSKTKPLTLTELSFHNKSKRSARERSFSDSLETSKSKQVTVLQHRSHRNVSNVMSPNLAVQGRGVMGENTPALKSMVSPPTTAKPVRRVRKTTDPSSLRLLTKKLVKDSSRKRRISFNGGKERLTESSEKVKYLGSHPSDPFDFKDDSKRGSSFAGKDNIQRRPKKIRALSFRSKPDE